MGHHVTVEGSVTPSDWLAKGSRRTVAVTDHVRRLVKIGAVVVVAGNLDDPDATAYGSPSIPADPVEVPAGESAEPDGEDTAGPAETLLEVDSDGATSADPLVPAEPSTRNPGDRRREQRRAERDAD